MRLYDLRTGTAEVVHTGHVGTPLIAGNLLMWPEAFAPDEAPRVVAINLTLHRPTPLPPQLAGLRDPQEIASDGYTFAWASADRAQLMAWQQDWPEARVVALTIQSNPITWPKVSGVTVSWVADRTYTADLRTGSYVPMTKAWAAPKAGGRAWWRRQQLPPGPSHAAASAPLHVTVRARAQPAGRQGPGRAAQAAAPPES